MTWFNQLFATPFAWLSQHAALGWWTVGLSLVATIGGLLLMRWFVLWIPHDYFVRPHAIGWQARHPLARLILLVGKNLAGAVLLILGLTMLVTPGPGIVMLLVGLLLLDVPGKRALERRIIATPSVLRTINRLRKQANRPALELPTEK